MLKWTCNICKAERPDDRISVFKSDQSVEQGLPAGTVQMNVRYCNDKANCAEKAKTFSFFKRAL